MLSSSLNAESIRELFDQVRQGKLSPDAAVDRVAPSSIRRSGIRQGGPPSRPARRDARGDLRAGQDSGSNGIYLFSPGEARRQHPGHAGERKTAAAVKKKVPKAEYQALARAIVLRRDKKKYGKGIIAVVSAGTSDIPVAEEAVVTAEMMGNDVEHLYDVGRRRNSSPDGESRVADAGASSDRMRRNGRRAAQRSRRTGRRSRDRRAHQRGLRGGLQRPGGACWG